MDTTVERSPIFAADAANNAQVVTDEMDLAVWQCFSQELPSLNSSVH